MSARSVHDPSSKPPRVGVMRLLAAHGLRPDTDLGQHFLLDENLVDLAIRQARVTPGDVALEVGPGAGVLTVALARAARHVHALELDRRLTPVLTDALSACRNVDVHWGDALQANLSTLDPEPTVIVANLPYNIATPFVVESLTRAPAVTRWCVMTQAEVADRWMAQPGSRLYGAPSVLIGLSATVVFRRAVGREVFTPRPRVDSALVAFERIGPGPSDRLRGLVRAAFATRRKTLVNTLAGAGYERDAIRAALGAIGQSETVRPENLAANEFRSLDQALGVPGG